MKVNNQILSNLKENKEDWYYICNDAEQALFKVKNNCTNEEAIKTIERMILDLNNIRMEQYNALKEYVLTEEETKFVKEFIKLPYMDFKAQNYIGILEDDICFLVDDDNKVYFFKDTNIEDLKNAIYNNDDEFNNFCSSHEYYYDNYNYEEELKVKILEEINIFTKED